MRLKGHDSIVGWAACVLLLGACSSGSSAGRDSAAEVSTADGTSTGDTGTGLDGTAPDGPATTDGGTDGVSGSDAPGASDAPAAGDTGGDTAASCAGMACPGFVTTAFDTGCTNDVSCVGELHQTDCCGAIRVLGINHASASTFCAAEYGTAAGGGCRGAYPSPAPCSTVLFTTDTGETTNDASRVAAHCVITGALPGVCTTYVCGATGGAPCPATRHIGTCG